MAYWNKISEEKRNEIILRVEGEIQAYQTGLANNLSKNSEIAESYGISGDSVKHILHSLSEEKRHYRTKILQHSPNPRKSKITMQKLREIFLSKIAESKDRYYIPLATAFRLSKNLVSKRVSKCYPIHLFESQPFLYLLGLFQESSVKLKTRFSTVYHDISEGKFIEELIYDLFGELPGDSKFPTKYLPTRKRIDFISEQVAYISTALTSDNMSPPYEILKSPRQKLSYLRGFLYRGAKVSSKTTKNGEKKRPRIAVRGRNKTSLIHRVGSLLEEFSIHTRQEDYGLAIYRVQSFQNLLELNLLSRQQRTKLETILESM